VAPQPERKVMRREISSGTRPMGPTATYLYCVVHAQKPPAIAGAPAGLAGAGPVAVREAGTAMWAAIAEVPLETYGSEALETGLRELEWVAQVALAHESVVEHFSRQRRSTVVPMQLFTMFSAEERAIAETRSRRREIAAVVKRIAGCEEWGVRMVRRPMPAGAGSSPEVRVESGAAFLMARKQARDAARDYLLAAAESAETAFTALGAIARDARRRDDSNQAGVVPPLLDAAFLVPEARRTVFKAAAKRLAARSQAAGVELTLSGPWPAYNFVKPGGR
jgi:hypothetical protein